jgi:hypothetical protein
MAASLSAVLVLGGDVKIISHAETASASHNSGVMASENSSRDARRSGSNKQGGNRSEETVQPKAMYP